MKREAVVNRLRAHEAELRRLGVQHLYLFGSTARDEAGADSDVDLFFDHERDKLNLFGLIDVKETATKILGCKTDIIHAKACTKPCGRGSKPARCKCSDGAAFAHSSPDGHC